MALPLAAAGAGAKAAIEPKGSAPKAGAVGGAVGVEEPNGALPKAPPNGSAAAAGCRLAAVAPEGS